MGKSKTTYDLDLFNYVSLTNDTSIESFVTKLNDIISKYHELLSMHHIYIYKFYSTSEFHFNNDIRTLILGMLLDSNIIPYKIYRYYGTSYRSNQKYHIDLLKSYFPKLIITKQDKHIIISKESIHEKMDIPDENLYQFDIDAVIYNDLYEEEIDIYDLISST